MFAPCIGHQCEKMMWKGGCDVRPVFFFSWRLIFLTQFHPYNPWGFHKALAGCRHKKLRKSNNPRRERDWSWGMPPIFVCLARLRDLRALQIAYKWIETSGAKSSTIYCIEERGCQSSARSRLTPGGSLGSGYRLLHSVA